jgi:hypothetical protein
MSVSDINELVLEHASKEVSIFAEISSFTKRLVLNCFYISNQCFCFLSLIRFASILNIELINSRLTSSKNEHFYGVNGYGDAWRIIVKLLISNLYGLPILLSKGLHVVSIVFWEFRCRLQI